MDDPALLDAAGEVVARPSKLTADTHDTIVIALRAGLTDEATCAVAGIAPRTFQTWIARGALPGRTTAPHRALLAAVERARAACEADQVARITLTAQRGSRRASAFLLERQYPDRWGPVERRAAPRLDDYDPLTG